jgi:hypothetical protein
MSKGNSGPMVIIVEQMRTAVPTGALLIERALAPALVRKGKGSFASQETERCCSRGLIRHLIKFRRDRREAVFLFRARDPLAFKERAINALGIRRPSAA